MSERYELPRQLRRIEVHCRTILRAVAECEIEPHPRERDEARREWEALKEELKWEEEQHIHTQQGHAKALRERDEARRDVARLQEEAKERLEQWSGVYESARIRAERAEQARDAAIREVAAIGKQLGAMQYRAERADAVRDTAIAFIRDLDRRIQQPLNRRSDTGSEMYFAYKDSGIGEAVRALDASGRGDG